MGSGLTRHSSSSTGHCHHSSSKKNYHTLKECKVWHSLQDPLFIYPELQELQELNKKIEFGIAVCGGKGSLAPAVTLGAIRGLHQLGLLQKARYISASSSSAWIIGPQAFCSDDFTALFEEYLPPEKCDLFTLKKLIPNSQNYLICKSYRLEKVYQGLVDGTIRRNEADPRDLWSQAVGQILFKPYGLNAYDHVPVFFGSHQESVRHNSGISTKKMDVANLSQYPFPIINGCTIVGGDKKFAPVEFTPLYYGLPTPSKCISSNGTCDTCGYLIEPFGFLAHPSASAVQEVKDQIKSEVKETLKNEQSTTNKVPISTPGESLVIAEIHRPHTMLAISAQAGISTFSPALASQHDPKSSKLDVSVSSIWNPITGETNPMIFCDSSAIDCSGIHALLRRKLRKIYAVFAMDKPIDAPNVDHRNYSHSNFASIAALFGVMISDDLSTTEGLTVDLYNQLHHVFPSEHFYQLRDGLCATYHEGKSSTYLLHTIVLPNSFANIPGGHDVEILFMVNAPSSHWVDLLPQNTKRNIRNQDLTVDEYNEEEMKSSDEEDEKMIQHRVKEFQSQLPDRFEEDAAQLSHSLHMIFQNSHLSQFPYPSSDTTNDYTAQYVNLLTNLMTWEVITSKDLFDKMLR